MGAGPRPVSLTRRWGAAMAKPRDAVPPPFHDGESLLFEVLQQKLGHSAGPERLDGPPPADSPSPSGGKRHIKPVADNDSILERLEEIVASEFVWEMIEAREELHNRDRPPNPAGRKQGYVLFDILVVEVATLLYPNALAAVNNLRDPKNWARLYQAAEDAFPNNPARRPSETAPSRFQRHRARIKYFGGEPLNALYLHYRSTAVGTATDMGLFDRNAGTWTHPHKSQSIVADMSWVPGATQHHRDAPFHPKTGRALRVDHYGDYHHYSNGHPTRVPGRKMVMMSCRTGHGNERVVLDAGFMPHNDSPYRKRGNESDFAVDMLRDLIDGHHDVLCGETGGLRCFIHDMAMHSTAIDNVLDMRILPVVKTPKLKGGKYRHGNLGPHEFTPLNGSPAHLNIMTVNGSMWVRLPDGQGTEWAVPLRRQHLYWGTAGKKALHRVHHSRNPTGRPGQTPQGSHRHGAAQQHPPRDPQQPTHPPHRVASRHPRSRPRLRDLRCPRRHRIRVLGFQAPNQQQVVLNL